MNKPSQPKDVPQVAVPASDTLRPPVADAIDYFATHTLESPERARHRPGRERGPQPVSRPSGSG